MLPAVGCAARAAGAAGAACKACLLLWVQAGCSRSQYRTKTAEWSGRHSLAHTPCCMPSGTASFIDDTCMPLNRPQPLPPLLSPSHALLHPAAGLLREVVRLQRHALRQRVPRLQVQGRLQDSQELPLPQRCQGVRPGRVHHMQVGRACRCPGSRCCGAACWGPRRAHLLPHWCMRLASGYALGQYMATLGYALGHMPITTAPCAGTCMPYRQI